ncbi:MAG: serine/threonine-protein kinase [Steroidobacteraceae bacterium]
MIGETIEHYRILELVGRGGMGSVYRAIDINLDRAVAVKILNAEIRNDVDFIERFRHEARVQAVLNHPNIATLFDFLIWRDSPVAVMEFIEGETLQAMIARRGPVPAHISLPLFKQALIGVAAGHRRGIIHRDLKPANLMVNIEGIIKITDFGIAKIQNSSGLTKVSTRIGSASYMAPEQIQGLPVDIRTDIYALGITLYELLAGRPPFLSKVLFELEMAHVHDIPVPPTAHYPHIPQAAVDATMRALAKDPNDRFGSVEEFLRALPDLYGVPYVGSTAADSALPGVTQPVAALHSPAAGSVYQAQSTNDPAASSIPTAGVQTQLRISQTAESVDRGPAKKAPIAAASAFVVVLAAAAFIWFRENPRMDTNLPLAKVSHPPTTEVSNAISTPLRAATEAQNQTIEQRPSPLPIELDRPKLPPPQTSPTRTARERSAVPPPVRAAMSGFVNFSGLWTGGASDTAGHEKLRIVGLKIKQVGEDISGTLTYQADSDGGGTCDLIRGSKYQTTTRRLELLIHCDKPNHPDLLNVPLDFEDVDLRTNALSGGHPYRKQDISVNLERAKGI